jgi:hypothetical protein
MKLTIDGGEVFLGLIVELLGLFLKLIEATFGIGIDGIFGMFTDVELDLELLWRTHQALLEAFKTHDGVVEYEGKDIKTESERVKKRKCQGRG